MDQPQIQKMLTAAVQERRAGRNDAAIKLFRDVVVQDGAQPQALNALGLHAIAQENFGEAVSLLRRAIAADPDAPELWMNLARAYRECRDDAAEEEALRGALSIDQRHFMALVRMAELFERRGDGSSAAERWSGVLAMAPLIEERPAALEIMLDHARDYVAHWRDGFANTIDRKLAEARAAMPSADLRRFDACIDHALGRRQIYINQCAGMHFPFLPADEFFAREHFAWFETLEAQADVIRAELEVMLADDAAAIRPYVAMEPGTPANKWSSLDHSLEWGAIHLWKDGKRDDAVCARVPRTAAIVEALPLSDLPGRTPTVFFSLLRQGAHLPAHTGVSNVRTIIHLPLIVPPDCRFRVGGETRHWKAGEAWAFDDTIEHEAWNGSDAMRAILIFDVWNPYITSVERDLLRQFYLASADETGAPASAIRVSE
ncbi:aspartyl/asparaginyl beta-hydroxylase domain-containing protein [Sphingobium boeckii]|uniref:Tfp pilus assembly protein PilF n=1 Tax=Sphingobium boeckii TaxID=1082345 RepID=A0A7W9AFJ1_9SPHN|nr:aspartyl/asparaginyl beta-hydroxylase domain-containing protein [Sphingobium boeckii]MBB5684658.1 Tfp pilus assembly protein PilF [Sphingobium boeckii]